MKPLIVGLRNPSPTLPALSPSNRGSSGWRLWRMWDGDSPDRTHRTQEEFLRAFDRSNLINDRDSIGDMIRTRSDVVVLGGEVWAGLKLDPTVDLLESAVRGSVRYWRVPHPSGRNLWYNSAANCEAVGSLLRRLTDG